MSTRALRHCLHGFIALYVVACGAALTACRGGAPEQNLDEPVVVYERERICLASATDTVPLMVEIAATRAQQVHGLMEREHLAADAGMLFTYDEPQPADHGFWMFRTRIPLAIAFIGPDGAIRSIQPMAPCESPKSDWCPTYPAGVEFSSALEVNQGFFREHGIQVGDRMIRGAPSGCGRV